MHPIDQISIGVQYSTAPNKISGALYHRVTTSCVYGRIGIEKVLLSPKSANFATPLKLLLIYKGKY